MAIPPAPQRIGPFPAGMDNRAPDYSLGLPDGAGHLLRDALNVDVTPQGSIKTRAGYQRAVSGADVHSLWSPLSTDFALYVDDGTIYRLNRDGTTQVVAPGFGASTPVRYAQVHEAVYFTDGLRVGSYHPVVGPTPAWESTGTQMVGDQALMPMPAGSNIAFHRNRLLVAVGQVLTYSEPFMPHLRDQARGFEIFPAPIMCVAAVEGGVAVVADKTYFSPGGFPSQNLQAVLPYGAPEQQAGYRDDGTAHWMSSKGLVSCSSAGEVRNLQDARIVMDVSGASATLYREADGMQAVVAALSNPSNLSAGVGSYAQARIVRKAAP